MTPFFPPDQIYSDDVYKRGKKLYVALATTIFYALIEKIENKI